MRNLRNYSCWHDECKLAMRCFSVVTMKWRSYYTCPRCDESDAAWAMTREHVRAMREAYHA